MEAREQFTFYASFGAAIKRIKKKADRADAYDALVNYALYGIEPDMDALPDAAAVVFDMARPILESGRKKAAGAKNKESDKIT